MDLISQEEAAVVARVTTQTIARWRHAGRLESYRAGRRILVDRVQVTELIEPKRVSPEPQTAA